MKTIVYSSIKGGTGKTSLSILTANCLASNGKKVLVIDMDIQNSLSFYYLNGEETNKNIAFALQTNLQDNIVLSEKKNIDIVASSFMLADLRAMSVLKLKNLLPPIADCYDFCIIDTAPTYDNIVLNAINAADCIITPVQLTQFDYKGAKFYSEKLQAETDKYSVWSILINNYQAQYEETESSVVAQFLQLFNRDFTNILDSRIPKSNYIQKHIDTNEVMSNAKQKEKIYNSVISFVSNLTGINGMEKGF